MTERFHILEKSSWASWQRGGVPGQVPRMSIPSALTAMPKPPSPDVNPDFVLENVRTVRDITKGLGLEMSDEMRIQRTVQTSISDPELAYRTRLNQDTAYLKLEPEQRRMIAQRATAYYRENGQDQNRVETLRRRNLGLRKGETFHMEKAETRGGSYHRRVTNKETGKHRYYYSEEDYNKHPDAHVSGREVTQGKCKAGLLKRVGKGCTIESLKSWSDGLYDDNMVKDAIRSAVKSGELKHKGGKLMPAAKNMGAV